MNINLLYEKQSIIDKANNKLRVNRLFFMQQINIHIA
jgi:hypothetical protein